MMSPIQKIDALINWFMPDTYKGDLHREKRVRMFLISHLFGPLLGHPITVFLYLNDPAPWPHVHILGASITAFWLFPIALKMFGRQYKLLAFGSVMNLIFAILWGSYNYGGVSSPFLVWFIVAPLLAFFYLGSSLQARIVIFSQIAVGLGAFTAVYLADGTFPVHIPVNEMVGVGIISIFCAASYVFLMASYYSSVVDSQSELLKEIERHEVTTSKMMAAKEDAERANGAKSEFLAKMSHELRTPLNAVLGYSEILLEDAEIDGRGSEIADLQKISAAGKHLLAMVNDILDISKIEAGKMELNLEDVDFDRLLDEVESTARPLAAKNTNEFIYKREESIGTFQADATKLRQAVFNLLSNSAKFTQNGKITLEAKREDRDGEQWISISITDTGVGISQDQQDSLFSNFSQANPAIAAKFGGTGLGLSLSQNLCHLMGGEISVESELGHGACFTIALPARTAVEAVVDSASEETEDTEYGDLLKDAVEDSKDRAKAFSGLSQSAPDGEKRERVLVVDDDTAFLELAERLLVKEGFSPISTDEPQMVLQIARTVKPTAILLDVLMPGLNGWDVLDTLKSDPATASIPVIILSVMDEPQLAESHGAVGCVAKPLDGENMKSVIRLIEGAGSAGNSAAASAKTANS
ncbi:MAG: ATP-binding protein [Rhizobiaceae bacterium]